ncbi:MAG: hypothetical protein SOT34_06550 [Candidatus Borkfalkiaceae bacterium]|nr:hypothetical protein [Christensenellaceae bacterium]
MNPYDRTTEERIAALAARIEALEKNASQPVFRTLRYDYATLSGADGGITLDFPVYATDRAQAEFTFSAVCPGADGDSVSCSAYLDGGELTAFPFSAGKTEGKAEFVLSKGQHVLSVRMTSSSSFSATSLSAVLSGYVGENRLKKRLIAANGNWYGVDYGNAVTFYNGDGEGVFSVYGAEDVSAYAYGTAVFLFVARKTGAPLLRRYGVLSGSFAPGAEIRGKRYRRGAVFADGSGIRLFGLRGGRLFLATLSETGAVTDEKPLFARASSVAVFAGKGGEKTLLLRSGDGSYCLRQLTEKEDGSVSLSGGTSLGRAEGARFVPSEEEGGFSVWHGQGGGVVERKASDFFRGKKVVREGDEAIRTADGAVVRLVGGEVIRE